MKVERAYTYTATKVSLKEETRKSLLLSSPREREKAAEEEKSQEKFVFVCLFVSSRVPPPPLDGKLCSFSPRLLYGWGHERRGPIQKKRRRSFVRPWTSAEVTARRRRHGRTRIKTQKNEIHF